MTLEQKLQKHNISIDELAQTAVSTYIFDPAIGTAAQVQCLVKAEFQKLFKDINVCALFEAGLWLEEAGSKGEIAEISAEKYQSDPVDLLADEILGQSLALYIAGTRAFFEFERLDKQKPGILAKLPPFLDDLAAGLIAGAMVRVCTK